MSWTSDDVWSLVERLLTGDTDTADVLADVISEGVDGGKTVFTRVESRAWTKFGTKHEGKIEKTSFAAITPGRSIVLFGARNGKAYRKRFEIGDIAEYDSYNLSYTGPIRAISVKRISIGTGWSRNGSSRVTPGDPEKLKSLDIHAFDWRNYDFDAEATAVRNHETMMHI